MPRSSIPLLIVLSVLCSSAPPADARSLRLQATRVEAPSLDLEGVRIEAQVGANGGSLRMFAQRLRIAELGVDQVLDWQCVLEREADAQVCDGPMRMADGRSANLRVRLAREQLDVKLQQDAFEGVLQWPLGTGTTTLDLRSLPAVWLAPALARHWEGGSLRAGLFDAVLAIDAAQRVHARGSLKGLTLGTHDGTLAVEGMDIEGTGDWMVTNGVARISAQLKLARGRADMGGLHAQLPQAPVELTVDASRGIDEVWDFARLNWHDPDVLEFDAAALFDPRQLAPLRRLQLHQVRAVFPLALQRYGRGVLAAHDLDGLALSGELRGSAALDGDGLIRATAETDRMDLRLPRHAILIDKLRGGFDWRRDGHGEARPISFAHARLDHLDVTALQSRWQIRDRAAHLIGPLSARLFGGKLTAYDLIVREPGANSTWLQGRAGVRGMGYDAADGSFGIANLAADLDLRLAGELDALHVAADASLHGGQALAGSVYVELPQSPVHARVGVALSPSVWRIERFDWRDPGVLDASLLGQWDPVTRKWLALQAQLRELDLARATDRYARSWLATRGYGQLQARGHAQGALAFESGRMRGFSLQAQAVDLVDGAGRFALEGLDGALDWNANAPRAPTSLGWRHAEFYKVPFGAARSQWVSDRDSLQLAMPLAVDVLGGQLRLEKFIAQPASPRGDRYEASFAVVGVQLPQMSAAFGWPSFPGNLSGGIPEIEFVGDRIEFHGGLDLYLFDGHLGVNSMSLERPFGSEPALGANIHFENFDLEQLTSAFSFGSMSGRLFGTIDELRLLDWGTVAFDAWLRTKGGGKMSYTAVDDITGISSGAPALQNLALKLVNTFRFGQLGVRCRLRDEVCTMGGIEPLPERADASDSLDARGYAIVKGAGLPRIDIVGHRRHVDWPTLVRRLRDATRGQAPVIE